MAIDFIYTASDLDRKRREVTDAARNGVAHIRDTDGMGLVMLSAQRYDVLVAVADWHSRLRVLARARVKPAVDRTVDDLGDLTWLRHFDDDDLARFADEIHRAVAVAYHDNDLRELDQRVHQWRAAAAERSTPEPREVLIGSAHTH